MRAFGLDRLRSHGKSGAAATAWICTVLASVLIAAVPGAHAAAGQSRVTVIRTAADREITRRLAQLNKLDGVIGNDQRLGANDKSALQAEVAAEVNGLTALKPQIDADPTLDAIRIDAQAIFTEYRVYALVTPKVWLVRTADDQQAVEDKLATISGKLQTRINSAQAAGHDMGAPQAALNDLNAKQQAAQAISEAVAQKVLPLQPTDYNSDHALLSGYLTQLQTAHADNEAAYTDAKTVVQSLKNL